MALGASVRFFDSESTAVNGNNINTLDTGGNVYKALGQDLQVDVTALSYVNRRLTTPAAALYAGASAQAVTPSQTNYVYLDATGGLVINTSGFPATDHIPLAEVVASATEITSITDRRPRLSLGLGVVVPSYTVAALLALGSPVQGSLAFATNGRKAGEGAGVGTGVLCYYDGSSWIAEGTQATVVA